MPTEATAPENAACAHMQENRCAVCHRPVQRKEGRGRPKEVHTTYCIVRSRMAELEDMLRRMEFGDSAAVKKLRGDMFAIVNGPLRADVVTINPTNDADI